MNFKTNINILKKEKQIYENLLLSALYFSKFETLKEALNQDFDNMIKKSIEINIFEKSKEFYISEKKLIEIANDILENTK